MRLENSIKNVYIGLFAQIIMLLFSFISRKVFILSLGTEFLGLNALFTSILSMLSIIELGIGTAILYNLYRPIALGNKAEISAYMNFYKKSYRVIALAILILGLILMLF